MCVFFSSTFSEHVNFNISLERKKKKTGEWVKENQGGSLYEVFLIIRPGFQRAQWKGGDLKSGDS